MPLLILVTLVWAFSFSLIGEFLAAQVDAYIAVFIRMLLAFVALSPFLRIRQTSKPMRFYMMAIGGVQIGLMYILLYHAFLFLNVAEVLLFTIFTPLYIALIDERLLNNKQLPSRWWLAATLSVLGAGIIRYKGIDSQFLTGFLLIQGANLCFAAGQVAYKRLQLHTAKAQVEHYALFFLGAALVSGLGMLFFADFTRLPSSSTHWAVLIWLGLGASGGGYLLWSMASKQVNIGQLATMNNALVPAGLLVNFLIWGQNVPWGQLWVGGLIILYAVWLCRPKSQPY
ncbi:EamA family transporter [Aliidiomarina taiwanensis]|uniref:EamA family transporter n=1 Tax=Aliidiomarina taiwanensis TaxID=946228 RepID=A0A432X9I1_9GAMM|nr:EamA family transporter [Aliidiomarina taiwanensis]RUO43966.1 EamA family transporter [Aliidiomarina taiwanensis]